MRMKMKNPFVIYGYEGPETFCDRVEATAKMLAAIRNGRNVTLLAERRIGKTGLIKNVFHELSEEGDIATIYVDIFNTQNLMEFTKRLASAVIGSMDGDIQKALRAAGSFFKSIRPSLSVDPITGATSYSFSLQPSAVESTLKECFDYLAGKGPCVVAIDEFQQIAEYPEKGTEGLLRSYIQFLPNARFVFAGSRHHMMIEMFASAKRPFYNSTQTLPLERLDREVYFEFAARLMSGSGAELEREVFDFLYDVFDGITWYLQMVLNRLFERGSATLSDVRRVIAELLQEKNWEYSALVKSLPSGSVRLLKAIAAEGKVKSVTAAEFIAGHRLGGPSSVHLSQKKLVDDELLYETDDGLVVYDRLFRLWLVGLRGEEIYGV